MCPYVRRSSVGVKASDAKMEYNNILSLRQRVDISAAYAQWVEAFGIATYNSIEYVKPA